MILTRNFQRIFDSINRRVCKRVKCIVVRCLFDSNRFTYICIAFYCLFVLYTKIGSMCRQSFGFGPNATHTGRKDAVVWRWCGGQCFGDGSPWIGDRSEEWISKFAQRHQRGEAIAARNDRLIAISTANDADNIQVAQKTIGTTNWAIATVNVQVGNAIATASLSVNNTQPRTHTHWSAKTHSIIIQRIWQIHPISSD